MFESTKGMLSRFLTKRAPSQIALPRNDVPATNRKFERVVVSSDKPAAQKLDGGATLALKEVIQVADLPKFSRTLQKGFVPSAHAHTVCPIQVVDEDSQRRMFAVVVVENMVHADVTEAAIAALSKEFQPANPTVYVATANVLAELKSQNAEADRGKEKQHRDSPLWKHFETIVEFALENGVSDLHVRLRFDREYSQVGFRMDGRVIRPRRFRYATDVLQKVVGYLYNFHGNSTTSNDWQPNASLQCQIEETIGGRRLAFRWGQLPTHSGVKIVLRIIQLDSSDAFKSLGREKGGAGFTSHQVGIWHRNLYSAGGGTLLSGVVNSGKSKTLQTLLSLLPSDYEINTAEDPIEYTLAHEGSNQHSTSRSMADDDASDPFNAFKLQNKRMDPDATMIGELRDSKTASTFRDSVLSGQRVYSTIHADDALTIPERLVSDEFGLTRDVIALPNFLKLLVYQALVPKNCAHCALEATSAATLRMLKDLVESTDTDPAVARQAMSALRTVDTASLERIERLFAFDPAQMRLRNPVGCEHCIRENVPELNGIRGRALVAQMVEPTLDMLALIRDAKNIELHHYYRSLRTASFDSENSDGKTPLQIAMFNVARGELCLSEVEKRFQTVDAYEFQLRQFGLARKPAARQRRSHLPSGFSRRPRANGNAPRIIVPNGLEATPQATEAVTA